MSFGATVKNVFQITLCVINMQNVQMALMNMTVTMVSGFIQTLWHLIISYPFQVNLVSVGDAVNIL